MVLRTVVVVVVLALAGCHKNVDEAKLTTRELPGFSIGLPSGKATTENLDYAQGAVQLDEVIGTGNVVRVGWEPGRMFDDAAVMAIGTSLGSVHEQHPERGVGPQGAPTVSVTVESNKGAIGIVVTTCGGRRIMIMASESVRLAHRIAASLQCHPDASKETNVDVVPWFTTLPVGWYQTKAPQGQLWLTDGDNAILARAIEKMNDRSELPKLLEKLMPQMGMPMQVDAWNGDRFPVHGTMDGKPFFGWALPFDCGTQSVLLMGMSNDAAKVDEMAAFVLKGHCLAPGETPAWPTKP